MALFAPNYPILTPEQANPFNQALKSAMQTYGQGVQAAYAPRMMQADIFHKMFSPLAQIASSPLALGMMPEQQNAIRNLLGQMINQYMGSSMAGGQGQTRGGFVPETGYPLTTGGGGYPASGGQAQYQDQGQYQANAAPIEYGAKTEPAPYGQVTIDENGRVKMLPQQGQGFGGAAVSKTAAPLYQTPFEGGKPSIDPRTGRPFVTPSANTVQKVQDVQLAVKNVKPLLDKIVDQSAEFYKQGSYPKLWASMASGELKKLGLNVSDILGDEEMANRYSRFQANQAKSIESLATSLGLSGNMEALSYLRQVIKPQIGETSEGYAKRIKEEISDLIRRYNVGSEVAGGGFSLEKAINTEQKKRKATRNNNVPNRVYKFNPQTGAAE